jgi:signal transduction histidine kinase
VSDQGVDSLKVSAHVLVQLGSELVTDVDQALLECVKNSYDADSVGCRIEIDTREIGQLTDKAPAGKLLRFSAPAESVGVAIYDRDMQRLDGQKGPGRRVDAAELVERHLHYTGRITIEDNGDGLSPDKISRSWLMISGSTKRVEGDKAKQPTRKGRTPLGDKGLGRLGSMKLGDILLVESATGPDKQIASAHFRWEDCSTAEMVEEVPVFTKVKDNTEGFKGTRVTIYGLRDMPDWRRKGRINELSRSLAKLISPFESTSTFPVSVTLDGSEESLLSVTDQVLNQAIAEFSFSWQPNEAGQMVLTARAKFMTRLFTAGRSKAQRNKADVAFLRDGGVGFREFLNTYSQTKAYKKRDPDKPGCFIELEDSFPWSDVVMDGGVAMTDPGAFVGAFYFFHLDGRDAPEGEAASGLAVTRDLVKAMAGISILRDGFRVRSQGDWLGLSSGMTSGSTYNLRVNNTIGYFALTGADNFRLVEKSDREGFVEDAAYRGFNAIAKRCLKFANESLEGVRRGLDAHYKKVWQEHAPKIAADPLGTVEKSAEAAEVAQSAARNAAASLDGELSDLEKYLQGQGARSPEGVSRALAIARKAVSSIRVVEGHIPKRVEISSAIEKVKQDRQDAQDQAMGLYESAAVGLSARGLAHELRTHIGDIRQRLSALTKLAKGGAVSEATLAGHVRAMRDSCSAILSAASLIDPMLPRSRMLKETFDVVEFAKDYVQLRGHELSRDEVAVTVTGNPFRVRMNRPRLLQVVDNLVHNSLYWLRRGYLTKTVSRPKGISIEVSDGLISVADSGPGVDPRYEESLFEMYVSGKPVDAGDGQGLGLFIVRQLLAADGCEIRLTEDRNPEGRRYRFTVDLRPVAIA